MFERKYAIFIPLFQSIGTENKLFVVDFYLEKPRFETDFLSVPLNSIFPSLYMPLNSGHEAY